MSRSYKKNPGNRKMHPELKRINKRKVRRDKDFAVNGGAYRRLVYYGYRDELFYSKGYTSFEQLMAEQQPDQKYFSWYSNNLCTYLDEEEIYRWWAKTYLRK